MPFTTNLIMHQQKTAAMKNIHLSQVSLFGQTAE